MIDGATFSGKFTVELRDGGDIKVFHSPNRILRVGLVSIVKDGVLPIYFSSFSIGSDTTPARPSQTGVIAPISGGVKAGSRSATLVSPQWGYTALYNAGEATGNWAEIGMFRPTLPSGVFLNRARFLNESGQETIIVKGPNAEAFVSVEFTLGRIL